jgi:phage baseplate assembly protein W
MAPRTATFRFPFAVNSAGRISASGGDDAIRGKVIQVLFTAPGERVHVPDFGCGLFNLVFEPNDAILAATMEFTVGQALSRWLGDDIVVDGVNIEAMEETVTVQIMYTKRQDLSQQAVRIHFR